MPHERGMPPTRNRPMMASLTAPVSIVKSQGILQLTIVPHLEAFNWLAEIGTNQWAEEIEELMVLTWRMKMVKNPQWGRTQDFIEDWRRGVLIVTTAKYHNLVIC